MHKMKSVAGRENDNFYLKAHSTWGFFLYRREFYQRSFCLKLCIAESEENNVRIESVWRMMEVEGGERRIYTNKSLKFSVQKSKWF